MNPDDERPNLKVDVNNFLFPIVPSDMTIGEFEELAVAIHALIEGELEIFKGRVTTPSPAEFTNDGSDF